MSIRVVAGSAQAVVANDGHVWALRTNKYTLVWWSKIAIGAGVTRAFQVATSGGTSRILMQQSAGAIYTAFQWSAAADFNVNSGVPNDGEWHCYAVVYDASSTANVPTIYCDAVPMTVTVVNAPTGSLASAAVTEVATYGNRHTLASALGGSLAHVAMWNNYLLSQEDVTTVFHRGPLALSHAPPTLYRPFDPQQPGGILRALGAADGAHLNPKGAHLYPFIDNDDPYRQRYVGGPLNRRRIGYASAAQTFVIGVATASATAQDVAATAGALAVAIGNATASATAHNVAAVAGTLNVAAGVAIATANGQDVTASFSGVTIVGVATAAAVGQNVNAAAGALAVPVGVATATATPRDVVATAGALAVPAGVATATAAGQNVTATAGALTVTLLTATAAAAAQSVLVTAGVLTIPAGVGVATAVPSPVSVTVSGVSVALGVAVASAFAQVPLVIYGSTAATIIAVQDVLDRSPSVAVFDRSPTAVVVLRSGAAVVQDRSPSFAIIEVT